MSGKKFVEMWTALGRNTTQRFVRFYFMLLTVLAFATLIIYIAGKFGVIKIIWSK